MRFFQALKVITIIMLIGGCKSCNNDPRINVDISEIPFEVKILRLDKDVFEKNPDSLLHEIPSLRKRYGAFFDVYCNDIVNLRSVNDTALAVGLKNFVTNPDINEIYKETQKNYPDFP
jgi:hypothetical protein